MNMMRYGNMRGNSKTKFPNIGIGLVTVVKRHWRYFAVSKTPRLFIMDIFRAHRLLCVTDPNRYALLPYFLLNTIQ